MKQIALSNGFFALVDDSDFDFLSQWKWRALRQRNTHYAYQGNTWIAMHRLLLGAVEGQQVDHRNRDGLDNQRRNLRLATNQQNAWNRSGRSGSTSTLKGVSWHPRWRYWEARICIDGKRIWLGAFKEKTEAKLAYDKKAIELFGEFAAS